MKRTPKMVGDSGLKLYRSTKDIRWFAFNQKIGWVMFPAEIDGWQKRRYARSIVLSDMREVPLKMGFSTGIPGARKSAVGALMLRNSEDRPIVHRKRKKAKIICLTCLTCNLEGCMGRCRFQSVKVHAFLKSA